MSIIRCICLEIHLSVQAPFQGAGVVESTIMSQHLLKSYDLYLLNIRQRQVLSTIIFNMRIKITVGLLNLATTIFEGAAT